MTDCRYAYGRVNDGRAWATVCVPHDMPIFDHTMLDRKVLSILWTVANYDPDSFNAAVLDRIKAHVKHALGEHDAQG